MLCKSEGTILCCLYKHSEFLFLFRYVIVDLVDGQTTALRKLSDPKIGMVFFPEWIKY